MDFATGGFANGQPPLRFLTALNRACHPERAVATEGASQRIERFHFLIGVLRIGFVHGSNPAVAGVYDRWAKNAMLMATRSGAKRYNITEM